MTYDMSIHAFRGKDGDSFPHNTIGSCFQFRYINDDHVVDFNEIIKEINDYFKSVSDYLKCDVNAHDWAEPIFKAIAVYRLELHKDDIINHLVVDMDHQILVDNIICEVITMLRKKYYAVIWYKPL